MTMRGISSSCALIISNHMPLIPYIIRNFHVVSKKTFVVTILLVDGHNMDKQLGHSIPLPYRYASTSSFIMQEIKVLLAVSLWLSGVVIDQTLKGVGSLFVVAEVSPSTVMVWYIKKLPQRRFEVLWPRYRYRILKISRLVSNVRKLLFLHQNFPD